MLILFNQSIFHDWTLLPNIDDLSTIHDSLHSITITVPDVYDALTSLDIGKSAGIHNISPRVIQSCITAFCEPLHHYFPNRYAMLLYHHVGKYTKLCLYFTHYAKIMRISNLHVKIIHIDHVHTGLRNEHWNSTESRNGWCNAQKIVCAQWLFLTVGKFLHQHCS